MQRREGMSLGSGLSLCLAGLRRCSDLLSRSWHNRAMWLLCVVATIALSSCSLPQIQPEDRLFLNLSLDYLGAVPIPTEFEGTVVGGLSGLTYDRSRNQFYAISDDRSNYAPARFYRFTLNWTPDWQDLSADRRSGGADDSRASNRADDASPRSAIGSTVGPAISPTIGSLQITQSTPLTTEAGEPFAAGTIDAEGIALSPRQTLFVASEGDRDRGIAPTIEEFDLETGSWRSRLPIPNRYLPRTENEQAIGVQNNQGFESLTLSATSYGNTLEPFRLFAAPEAALFQDLDADSESATARPIRLMHYLVGDQTLLLAEHLYTIDPLPAGAENLGLSDLLVLDQGGHFLSLERSFGLTGFGIRIFQLAFGGATDIAPIPALSGALDGITPIQKRLLLDLATLGIPLDNYEGMAIGPQLPDGSQSLILISDDNFNPLQTSELLVFRLRSS